MSGIWPSIIINGVLPYIAFQYLTGQHVSTINALLISGIFPVLGTVYGFIRTRRVDIIGVASLILIALSVATTLISGSVFFYLMKESAITGLLGLILVVSLLLPRPAMFYVSRQFASAGNPALAQRFEHAWAVAPQMRHGIRLITAVWGIAYLAEALIRVGLIYALGLQHVASLGDKSNHNLSLFLLISPLQAYAVTIAIFVWMFWYIGRLRRQAGARWISPDQATTTSANGKDV